MRRRRTIYVELNRRMEFHVHKPMENTRDGWEISPLYTDFFVLTMPEVDSLNDIWLVKTLTVDTSLWLALTDDCVDEIGLDSRMSQGQVAEAISDHQLWQSTSGEYVYERTMTKFADEYGRYDHDRWMRLHGPENQPEAQTEDRAGGVDRASENLPDGRDDPGGPDRCGGAQDWSDQDDGDDGDFQTREF